MMKRSRRAKRMERHHSRNKGNPAFNVISLMDIFTILVFFLLVSASEIEILPNVKDIELPESVAQKKPKETVIVVVTENDILLEGSPVVTVADALGGSESSIASLKTALQGQLKPSTDPEDVQEITIMGDKEIPFRLLKKVMVSCTEAGFTRISLSVVQKPSQQG